MQCCNMLTHASATIAAASFGTGFLHVQHDDTAALVFMRAWLDTGGEDGQGLEWLYLWPAS